MSISDSYESGSGTLLYRLSIFTKCCLRVIKWNRATGVSSWSEMRPKERGSVEANREGGGVFVVWSFHRDAVPAPAGENSVARSLHEPTAAFPKRITASLD